MKKNPYSTKKGFLPNPANPLYQDDIEISDNPEIQELCQLAHDLEDGIEGDFDLNFLITEIKNNSLSFCRIGIIAFKVKSLKLYKKVAKTFKQFCEEQIGYSVWYVNRLIVSSKVVFDLIAANFDILPKCESQARELLYASEGEVVPAWRSVVEHIKPHKITAKSIRQHLKPDQEKEVPETEKIEVPHNLFETIYRNAVQAKMTVVQLLEEIFQPLQNCDNWHFDTKIEKWQQDLEKLCRETDST